MLATLCLTLALQSGPATAATAQQPAPTRVRTPPETPRDAVFGELEPATVVLDDAIPLPDAATWEVGATADTLAAPAHGDPFFLGFAPGAYYPPAAESLDPELALRAWTQPRDGRPEAS